MSDLSEKICPLLNQKCLLNECAFFNPTLDGCEVGIMNYNLYQLKQAIRSILNLKIDPNPFPVLDGGNKPRYPRNPR
jgi:hypothetical protein